MRIEFLTKTEIDMLKAAVNLYYQTVSKTKFATLSELSKGLLGKLNQNVKIVIEIEDSQ